DQIERLAYALSITPHATASLLLETGLQHGRIVNAYVTNHCRHALDDGRLKELKEVYRVLNHGEEKISFTALISAIVENVKIAGKSAGNQLKEKLTQWLDEP
ncbi:MAG: hypothetical protein K0Q87_194, partial [Neobacillus sp.]|nr:hypothetical protein [Neobacillus sp.]